MYGGAGVYTIISVLAQYFGAPFGYVIAAAIAAGLFTIGGAGAAYCNRNGTGSEYRWASRISVFWCVQQ